MSQIGLLDYVAQPPAVFVSEKADLSLVISNPLSGSPVVFQGGRPQDADQLQITFVTSGSNALTDSLDFVPTITEQPQLPDPPGDAVPFSAIKVGTNFFVKPRGTNAKSTATLLPGQSLTVTFTNVTIDSDPGTGNIDITQLIGTGGTPSGTLGVSKKPLDPAIVPWLDPPLIAEGQTSTLRWTAVGGTEVQVIGFPYGPGTKDFPLNGPPPASGETTASVLQGTHTQPYTLNVIKPGTGTVASGQVTLQFHVPFISTFVPTAALPPLLPVDQSVTFQYATVFASTASLITPIRSQRVPDPVNGSLTVHPGEDAYQIGGNSTNIPGATNYTFEAKGYLDPAYKTIPISLAPIEILYFKYLDNDKGTLSRAQASIVPETWPGMQIESEGVDLLVLTVWGPGGQMDQRYLGNGDTTHPQIQFFDAGKPSDEKVELSWVTANLTKLVLDPGNIDIPSADIAKSTKTIDIGSATEIVLTGTAANGQSVRSVIVLDTQTDRSSPCPE